MRSFTRLAAAALCALAASTASAAVLGTRTISNATHYGYFAFPSTSQYNTKSSLGPFTGIGRVLNISGTVTKVHADAWLSSIQVQPSGTGLATYQPWIEFSDKRDFEGTVNVSAKVYAPGGFDASKPIFLEAFSLDAEEFVPGIDARSTLTYTVDSSFAPGTAEYSGTLAATDPTFNRPAQYRYANGLGQVMWYDPELTGAFPHYDVQPFHVSTAGEYSMVSANEFESSSVLYANGFNPANSLANVVKARNQSGNVLRSIALNNLPFADDAVGATSITADLVPGVQYYYVTTAFNAPGIEPDGGPFLGKYRNIITGAGNVTLGIVPEPTTLAGLAGMLAFGRRRA